MDEELFSLKWNAHKTNFFQVLGKLRQKGSYTDVTLACEGRFFGVHKLVLATCSDYFNEVLEETVCQSPYVILSGISCQDLEYLLDYMYLGEISVPQSKIPNLIKAAESLKIKGLAVCDEPPEKAYTKSETIEEIISTQKSFYNDRVEMSAADILKMEDTNSVGSTLSLPQPETFMDQHSERSFEAALLSEPENGPTFNNEGISQQDLLASINDAASKRLEGMLQNINPGHYRTSRMPPKKHECRLCRREFASKQSLRRHALRHTGEKPFKCRICSAEFRHQLTCKTHMMTHTGQKPYACTQCSYSSYVKRSLALHTARNHS